MIACKSLLEGDSRPDARAIRMGLGGNLCRCGTYAGIQAAIEQLKGGRHG